MKYIMLFYEFLKAGLFAIGGGLATLPFLYDISKRTGWISANEITDMVAVSQSTPGPLGINMASYTGYLVGGPLGAIVATTGLVFPSVVIILIIAKFLEKFQENQMVTSAFYGLKPASLGLITIAWLGVLRITYLPLPQDSVGRVNWLEKIILAIALLIVLRKWKLHPILVIVLAAVIGIIFRF